MNRIIPLMLTLWAVFSCSSAYQPSQESEQVNVGYGVLDRKEVSTSVSKVDSKDVDNAGFATIYDYLEGRVPGLVIRSMDRRSRCWWSTVWSWRTFRISIRAKLRAWRS